jgi:hypothetical protein
MFLSMGCSPRVLVIPADRTVKALPDGNYEITPALLQQLYDAAAYWKARCGPDTGK